MNLVEILTWSGTLIMGIITSTFGGLFADIFRNEVPDLLKKGEVYATASALGAVALLAGRHLLSDDSALLFLCVGLVVWTRVYAHWKGVRLPGI
jgi:uncharacterized membrane protein YeiH